MAGWAGAAVSRELYPCFTYSNCFYISSLFRPEIMRDPELSKHCMQILPCKGGAMFADTGGYFGMFRSHDANRRELAPHSRRDTEGYDRYSRHIQCRCQVIRPMLMRRPPDLASFRPRDLAELAWLGKQLTSMSEMAAYATLAFWTMSIADYLDAYFDNPVVKAYQAVGSIT